LAGSFPEGAHFTLEVAVVRELVSAEQRGPYSQRVRDEPSIYPQT
jgi:hypothetical protein